MEKIFWEETVQNYSINLNEFSDEVELEVEVKSKVIFGIPLCTSKRPI